MTGSGDISIRRSPGDVPGLQPAWTRSEQVGAFHGGNLTDYQAAEPVSGEDQRRIATLEVGSGPDLVLPFMRVSGLHKFTIGERRIGALKTQALHLVNPWMAEGHTAHDTARLLEHVLVEEKADLIALGEIPESSDLRRALNDLSWSTRKFEIGRKKSLRWLIDLPPSFDTYLAGLSSSTRQSTRRKMRKLEKDFDVRFEMICTPQEVERFLEEGEKVSRLTYQWNVGQQLRNDAETRAQYMALAEQGRLRCYLMFLDGTARAFLRGTIEGDIYHYETPGFDPAFRKQSVGTIILMDAVQELIENTSCQVFDFGTGGDDTGYKSTYGTRHIICNSYYVLYLQRPTGLTILVLDSMLSQFKNLAGRLLSNTETRDRIKRWLRKYGS